MAYTFQNLLDAIKEEGRVDRGNDLDAMIKRIINEVMVKHTRNKEYPDLYTVQQPITIPSDGISHVSLPVDFARVSQVRFSTTGDSWAFLKKKNMYSLPYLTGYPQWWYIAGSDLYIHPYSELLTTHQLQIDYYKVPAALVNPTDILLIDDLYPVIVNETLSRVRRYHNDEQGAQAFKREAVESNTTQQDE